MLGNPCGYYTNIQTCPRKMQTCIIHAPTCIIWTPVQILVHEVIVLCTLLEVLQWHWATTGSTPSTYTSLTCKHTHLFEECVQIPYHLQHMVLCVGHCLQPAIPNTRAIKECKPKHYMCMLTQIVLSLQYTTWSVSLVCS